MKLSRIVIMAGLVALAACTSRGDREPGETRLHQLRNNRGTPEEFAIVPNKPLQQPANFGELPQPVVGAANRADQTPQADVVAALGGNPARLASDGVPSGDGALINRASRFGRDAGIRTQLATEDAEFRQRKSIFNWKLVPDDEYARAYRTQWLDSYGVLEAYRRRGILTPSAPPAE